MVDVAVADTLNVKLLFVDSQRIFTWRWSIEVSAVTFEWLAVVWCLLLWMCCVSLTALCIANKHKFLLIVDSYFKFRNLFIIKQTFNKPILSLPIYIKCIMQSQVERKRDCDIRCRFNLFCSARCSTLWLGRLYDEHLVVRLQRPMLLRLNGLTGIVLDFIIQMRIISFGQQWLLQGLHCCLILTSDHLRLAAARCLLLSICCVTRTYKNVWQIHINTFNWAPFCVEWDKREHIPRLLTTTIHRNSIANVQFSIENQE